MTISRTSKVITVVGFSLATLKLYNNFFYKPILVGSTQPKNSSTPSYGGNFQLVTTLVEIKKIVGEENVSTTKDVILQHSDSAWQFYHAKENEKPDAVVYPANTEEVSEIMKLCNEAKIPVTAYSGGTSLEGHFTPVHQGISLDMSRMNQVLRVNKRDLDCVVQPAVGWEQLNDVLSDHGLLFGVDPGPAAEIGGMVNTCASGTRAYRYGTMRQNVLGLVCVLADGQIIKTRQRPRKSSAGYSLTDLVLGSEGTLAIVCEVTVKVHPIPKFTRIGALSFPNVRNASRTVEQILQSGRQLDAMELMDAEQMRLVNGCGITSHKWSENDTLLLRFAGPTMENVQQDIDAVLDIAKQNQLTDLVFAKNEEDGNELWAARKNALYSLLHSAPKGYLAFGTDTAVPISQLANFVEDAQAEIKRRKLMGSILGHVGDGNFHVSIAYDPKTEKETVEDLAQWLARRSIELEGTCTGEHGIGMGKRELLIEELGDPAVDTMRRVKFALDPNSILNPGKIFEL